MQIASTPKLAPSTFDALRLHVQRLLRKHAFIMHLEPGHKVIIDEEHLVRQSQTKLRALFSAGLRTSPLFSLWRGQLRGLVETIARYDVRYVHDDPETQERLVAGVMNEDLEGLWPQRWSC